MLIFALKMLEKHLNSPYPEAKLSVIYQYLVIAKKEDKLGQKKTAIQSLENQFEAIFDNIPQHLKAKAVVDRLKDNKKDMADDFLKYFVHFGKAILNGNDDKKAPYIPQNYWAKDIINFKELSPRESQQLKETANTFIHLIDMTLYHNITGQQDMTDCYYISYEWLIENKTFSKNRHLSYLTFINYPFGPYAREYRYKPPMLNDKQQRPLDKSSVDNTKKTTDSAKAPTSPKKVTASALENEIEEKPYQAKKNKVITFFSNSQMDEVSRWTGGKIFGTYRDHKVLKNDIRILLHSGGFAIFFPPDIFHAFDKTVPMWLADNTSDECWIAGPGFGYQKIDVNPNQITDKKAFDYINEDTKIAFAKVENYIEENFIHAQGLFPDAKYNSIGAQIDGFSSEVDTRIRLSPYKVKL